MTDYVTLRNDGDTKKKVNNITKENYKQLQLIASRHEQKKTKKTLSSRSLLNSAELSYQADINSLDTLKKIVMRVPVHMQAKWADESGKILEMGSEPTFSHLADFLEKRALIANTEFGKLVGFKLGESRVTKQPRKAADNI